MMPTAGRPLQAASPKSAAVRSCTRSGPPDSVTGGVFGEATDADCGIGPAPAGTRRVLISRLAAVIAHRITGGVAQVLHDVRAHRIPHRAGVPGADWSPWPTPGGRRTAPPRPRMRPAWTTTRSGSTRPGTGTSPCRCSRTRSSPSPPAPCGPAPSRRTRRPPARRYRSQGRARECQQSRRVFSLCCWSHASPGQPQRPAAYAADEIDGQRQRPRVDGHRDHLPHPLSIGRQPA